jgi:hypothetical protein
MSKAQLEKNIAYLIDELDYNDTQIGLILRALDEVNCPSAEYFVNEFLLD